MRSKGIFVSLATALLISGCSNAAPTCSSEIVLNTVKKLAMRDIEKIIGITVPFKSGEGNYDISVIRTVASDSNSCSCNAKLKITLELNDEWRGFYEKESTDVLTVVGNVRAGKYADYEFDVIYTAEKTDDGKDTYVNYTISR